MVLLNQQFTYHIFRRNANPVLKLVCLSNFEQQFSWNDPRISSEYNWNAFGQYSATIRIQLECI